MTALKERAVELGEKLGWQAAEWFRVKDAYLSSRVLPDGGLVYILVPDKTADDKPTYVFISREHFVSFPDVTLLSEMDELDINIVSDEDDSAYQYHWLRTDIDPVSYKRDEARWSAFISNHHKAIKARRLRRQMPPVEHRLDMSRKRKAPE